MSSSSNPIKCSILGAGLSLQAFHYPFLATYPSLFTLHSVLERSATAEKSAARSFTGIKDLKVVNTIEEIVGDDEVELVIVSVPNLYHFDYAKKALEAGKHVLLEKPITPTYAQAKELVDLAKSKGLILAPFQNRRWDSDFLGIQEILKKGELGQLTQFNSHFDRFRPDPVPNTWKEAPGAMNESIYNLGSHVIDQAVVLFGKPERVGCWSYSQRAPGLDDSFLMHLYYPSSHPLSKPYPLLVTLSASMISPGSRQLRYQIKGNKGQYIKYGLDTQEATLRKMDWTKGEGKADEISPVGKEGWGAEERGSEAEVETLVDGKWESKKYDSPAGSYETLYKSLHEAIRSGKGEEALLAKPSEAALVIKLIEVGLQASREGRIIDFE